VETTENPEEVTIQRCRQETRVQRLLDQLDVEWESVNDADSESFKELVENFSDVLHLILRR